jgi:hypothetical protein
MPDQIYAAKIKIQTDWSKPIWRGLTYVDHTKRETKTILFQNLESAHRFFWLCFLLINGQKHETEWVKDETDIPNLTICQNESGYTRVILIKFEKLKLYREIGHKYPCPVCEGQGWVNWDIQL